MVDERPVLYQLHISHYNEKVRWALDYKRIPHTRRSLLPGVHRVVAQRLTGAVTTPVMVFDGCGMSDSTAILQELELRWPQPPLMPEDAEQRERVLELEEFFDEELGPDIRRAVYWELLPHPEVVVPLFTDQQPPASRALMKAGFPVLRNAMRGVFEINAETSARSREKTYEALDRLEEELGDGDYLVGDRFTIADLTAASLFYPIALPPEYPYRSPDWDELPESARDFLGPMRERPGALWVAEMYRRHRLPA